MVIAYEIFFKEYYVSYNKKKTQSMARAASITIFLAGASSKYFAYFLKALNSEKKNAGTDSAQGNPGKKLLLIGNFST